MIPPSYVDNFYDDPDQIVNTALGLKYYVPNQDENSISRSGPEQVPRIDRERRFDSAVSDQG